MAYRHEAASLLRDGKSLDEIATIQSRDLATVIQDLRLLVGEGQLRLSELYYAVPLERRQQFEASVKESGATTAAELHPLARSRGFVWHELDLYFQLRDPRIFHGDLYERLAEIEIRIHSLCRRVLIEAFGEGETGWWRHGVPQTIRSACVSAREGDPEPVSDPFCYTTLIHLSEIVERHWTLFVPHLQPIFAKDKKGLLKAIHRLNTIRNAVMHPVKNRTWTREDLDFVRKFGQSIALNTGIQPTAQGRRRG